MFYDIYCDLCRQKGLPPSGAAVKIGFNRASITVWKNSGKAPKQELLQARIDQAAKLLRYTNTPVTDIAAECGFQSIYYFSKYFVLNLGT